MSDGRQSASNLARWVAAIVALLTICYGALIGYLALFMLTFPRTSGTPEEVALSVALGTLQASVGLVIARGLWVGAGWAKPPFAVALGLGWLFLSSWLISEVLEFLT